MNSNGESVMAKPAENLDRAPRELAAGDFTVLNAIGRQVHVNR
jgi:hypothetical protein